MSGAAEPDVTHNRAAQRYELVVDGHRCVAEYQLRGNVAAFTHTEVPAALGGRGIGSRLIAAALDDTRRQGWKIAPICSFVGAYLERHPQYQDLVAA